jgi:hypothetical protein
MVSGSGSISFLFILNMEWWDGGLVPHRNTMLRQNNNAIQQTTIQKRLGKKSI